MKVCKGPAAAEDHAGGNAQPAGHRTDPKNLQQRGIKNSGLQEVFYFNVLMC